MALSDDIKEMNDDYEVLTSSETLRAYCIMKSLSPTNVKKVYDFMGKPEIKPDVYKQ